MKIQTNDRVHIGQTVKFAKNIKVTFDGKGVAEVSNEEGKFLLERYKGMLFPEGKVVKEKSVTPTFKDGSALEVLNEKLSSANHMIESLRLEVTQAKEGENIWRSKCSELLEENKKFKSNKLPDAELDQLKQEYSDLLVKYNELESKFKENKDHEETEEEKLEREKKEADLTLRKKLEDKTVKELTEMITELKLPEEEWKNKKKLDLINYLIEKSNV